MSRGTCAVIDLSALRHNYDVIKQRVGESKVLAVVKADGYGHGMTSIAKALPQSDGFGVAILEEALLLRASGITQKIVMLEGALSLDELKQASVSNVDVVVHQLEQVDDIEKVGAEVLSGGAALGASLNVWLKIDTGMHRLGVDPSDVLNAYQRLRHCAWVQSITLMSHFSCADEIGSVVSAAQYRMFNQLHQDLLIEPAFSGHVLPASLANSAGIFQESRYHFNWVRPGIALYGSSPIEGQSAADLGLKPVMTLVSRIIALRNVPQGESVGYGASWTAKADTQVAIVAIGYGDGYPRHVQKDAQVLVSGLLCDVIGRVSMDMIAVDVSHANSVGLNDSVTLWGNGLPVERVAEWAGTVNYELLCQVTDRVDHRYLDVQG